MENRERREMQQGDKEVIKLNLSEYGYMRRFFGNIIERRLTIPSYKYGLLTNHLLYQKDEGDLEWFEMKLESYYLDCKGFEHIFEENVTSRNENIDMTIRKMLAQIKVVELLLRNRFKAITKIPYIDLSTVDFSAHRNNQNYAIVVSLGLTEKEQNQSDAFNTIIENLEQQPGKAITNGINENYPRIKNFCHQRRLGGCIGIIVISIGYDYFISPLHSGKRQKIQRDVATELIKERWDALQECGEDYKHLSHIILIDGQDTWHIYPRLKNE